MQKIAKRVLMANRVYGTDPSLRVGLDKYKLSPKAAKTVKKVMLKKKTKKAGS
jgi:hypothetical protein